jgi:curli production assembly/transport component CsgG
MKILIVLMCFSLFGCAATGPLLPMKFETSDAEVLQQPQETKKVVREVPPPQDGKIVVAVYSFRDATGQKKQQTGVASFSTAVTQGGEGILIKALQDIGDGQWFRVVERVGLDNLLKERQLIRSARDEAKDPSNLRPILFAGMLLEASIVSYDSNVRTGGLGWRWLGIGPSTSYNEDVVTISMRVVSTQTGEILLTTNVRKTLLSYQIGMATFKFFDAGTKAFENEIGMSSTEVGIFVLKSATEKAVEELIFDGEKKGLWKFKTSKQEEVVKKDIDEKPVSTALPVKDVIEEKTTEVVTTKPTTYYLKEYTKLYYKKSNLKGPLYGPFKYYVKDTEVNVLPTEYNDVVEVTLKDGLKMYVKKDNLKETK